MSLRQISPLLSHIEMMLFEIIKLRLENFIESNGLVLRTVRQRHGLAVPRAADRFYVTGSIHG